MSELKDIITINDTDIEVAIAYKYHKPEKGTYDSYGDTIEPCIPEYIEIVSVKFPSFKVKPPENIGEPLDIVC